MAFLDESRIIKGAAAWVVIFNFTDGTVSQRYEHYTRVGAQFSRIVSR